MAKISDNAIAEHARKAGFSGPHVAVSVAVAIAESGGNPENVNPNDTGGTQSYGLWQINSVHKELLSSGNWRDPAANARMAYTVFQRQGWKAWGVYNSGKYLLYMPRGTAAAAFTEGKEQAGEVIDAVTPIDEISKLFSFITDRSNWLRLGMIIGGSAMILIVLWPMVRNSAPVKTVETVATTVAKVK